MAPPAKSIATSVAFAASGTDWLASKPAAACGDEGARPICRLPPVEEGSGPVCGLPKKSAVTVRRGAVTLSLAVTRVPEP